MTERRAIPLGRVRIDDPFWTPRQDVIREVTLDLQHDILQKSGAIDALKMQWKEGQPNPPHPFWESDVAKWIEAAGYSLTTHPDPELEARVDAVIDIMGKAQQPDGYLYVYYSLVEPGNRWTNLRDKHEMYCAGHLIEAAVAYYEATGKRKFLDIMCRYADYIDSLFGPGEGQRRGYPGHEELELALVKLHRLTGQERYLRLAQYFVNERGAQPHYFDIEARERGEDPAAFRFSDYDYNQSHLPIREQETADGHSVRAMYLYSGAADIALATGDETLLPALQRLWHNTTRRRMYVTGGIGSTPRGERFTYDYDLPNMTAYTETCASIGLAFWAQRMLLLDLNGDYADVLELALYNGIISGGSLDGTRFFYSNPLEVDRRGWESARASVRRELPAAERQGWFRCACCPPNLARFVASLGTYAYAEEQGTAYVHLYLGSTAELDLGGQKITLTQEANYPWDPTVRLKVDPAAPGRFTVALRVPAWCRAPRLTVNGADVAMAAIVERGYARLERDWQAGDVVELTLPMTTERLYPHPRIIADSGRVALRRGPVVFCLEQVDNIADLNALLLPRDADLTTAWDEDLLGGVYTVAADGYADDADAWDDVLYRTEAPQRRPVPIKAVPYFAWGNRKPGSMLVWVREGGSEG